MAGLLACPPQHSQPRETSRTDAPEEISRPKEDYRAYDQAHPPGELHPSKERLGNLVVNHVMLPALVWASCQARHPPEKRPE